MEMGHNIPFINILLSFTVALINTLFIRERVAVTKQELEMAWEQL